VGSFLPCFSPIPPLAPQRATLFLLVRAEIIQWLPSQPYRLERGIFETPAPGCHFVWFCNICDSLVTLRKVRTSRKLPGKLPEKLPGLKITGATRNTQKVYGDLPGDLPGPIIYRVFRETGSRTHYRVWLSLLSFISKISVTKSFKAFDMAHHYVCDIIFTKYVKWTFFFWLRFPWAVAFFGGIQSVAFRCGQSALWRLPH